MNNDPRLTAYVLGELSPTDTKEIEMLLEKNKDLKNEVEDIKAAVNIVTSDLNEQTSSDQFTFSEKEIEGIEKLSNSHSSKINKWSQKFLYWGGPAVLVCFLVILNVKDTKIPVAGDLLQKSTNTSFPPLIIPQSDDENRSSVPKERKVVAKKTKITNQAIGRSSSKGLADTLSATRQRGQKAGGAAGSLDMMEADAPASYPTRRLVSPLVQNIKDQVTPQSGESYDVTQNENFSYVKNKPLSTFSIDVDTASYSNMRRFLNNGNLPPVDAVRIEEFVNYFNYDYKHDSSKHPISIHMEQSFSPWNKKNRLVKVAMKTKSIAPGERPSSNFVFLLDVSGSMGAANKLPLLKNAMKLLTRKLTEKDRLAIVVYAGASGVVLPSTNGLEKAKILQSLTRLNSGGGTNGEAGILAAYKIAKENFIKGGNNRIILATDGDFNLGTTNRNSLVELVANKAKDNIFLTVLGLGMGNYKDGMLEKLADQGNGNYAYLDTLNEAKKVLITDMDKTLHTVAKDVKVQVEFNPKLVSAYRLIGYENRKLAAKDFNDDKKDAGEVGAGHNVTAFYEIVPVGTTLPQKDIDPLKYQKTVAEKTDSVKFTGEFMNVKVRYKTPTGLKSTKFEQALAAKDIEFTKTTDDFRFAAAVASFGMVLRTNSNVGDMNIFQILETAKGSKGKDRHGYRQEFIENVELARDIYKTQNK